MDLDEPLELLYRFTTRVCGWWEKRMIDDVQADMILEAAAEAVAATCGWTGPAGAVARPGDDGELLVDVWVGWHRTKLTAERPPSIPAEGLTSFKEALELANTIQKEYNNHRTGFSMSGSVVKA